LNNATLFAAAPQDDGTDFDALTRKDYVDNKVANALVQADGYRFGPIGNVNAFAITKISNSTTPFVLQTDLSNASTVTVQNDLRLNYAGTKTLTDDSLMRRADVSALITSLGLRRSYLADIYYGDNPLDANFTITSSPAGFVTSCNSVI
jgi:hypothetical protein